MQTELNNAIVSFESATNLLPKQFDYLRSFIAINVRESLENILNKDSNPMHDLIEILNVYKMIAENQCRFLDPNLRKVHDENSKNILEKTTEMYGNLFVRFNDDDVLSEAHDLLKQRLEKNNVNPNLYKDKICLDAGCGGGRYTIALKKMGAKIVYGIDGSDISINDAKNRISKYNIEGCMFSKQNVLNIEYDDSFFDFVMSYGVLHHTENMKKGLEECYRVLKSGGALFLFLMSQDGLRYEIIKCLRSILVSVDPNLTQSIMIHMGYDARKTFNFIDNLHVPIHINIEKQDLENLLKSIGFNNVTFMHRDIETKRWTHPTELIYQNKPYAKLKYGSGAYKYMCYKS